MFFPNGKAAMTYLNIFLHVDDVLEKDGKPSTERNIQHTTQKNINKLSYLFAANGANYKR